jgi:hypothetical protein
MARGWVHTVNKGGQWVNEVEGGGVISRHHTKETATAEGRKAAIRMRTEHVIHNMDGTISGRQSYGPDKFPPRG